MTAWDARRLTGPRFTRFADLIERVAQEPDWPAIDRLDAAFAPELRTVGMRLVEAGKTKPARGPDGLIDPASLYEVRIVDQGEIPTRPCNAHDFLNALIWAAFPRSKLALSRSLAAIQRARATGRSQLPSTRTREHDRLALVDEGALLCVTSPAGASTWIFGHAILEHAYAGERAVRGSAVDLEVEDVTDRSAIDRAFAAADLARVVRGGAGIPVE